MCTPSKPPGLHRALGKRRLSSEEEEPFHTDYTVRQKDMLVNTLP